SAVEPFARAISREHSSGPVGSVGGRRQPENQHTGFWITERLYGSSPIFPIAICATLHTGDLRTVLAQPRTKRTGGDFGMQTGPFPHRIHRSWEQEPP